MGDHKQEYDEYLKTRQSQLNIVATTRCPSGAVIDWIPIESQGEICSPPPAPKLHSPDYEKPENTPRSELQLPDADLGPEGTVPVLRPIFTEDNYKIPLRNFLSKSPNSLVPHTGAQEEKDAEALPKFTTQDATAIVDNTTHWRVNSGDYITLYGAQGQFSMFSPSVDKNADFSLIQLWLVRGNGAARGDLSVGNNLQTLEAGWVKYPDRYHDNNMHLFTYFTATGYGYDGDYVGGWNEDHPKNTWKQYDSQVHPGAIYSTISAHGGEQYKLWLVYQLWQGNWWLWAVDRWIGYYPASYFAGGLDPVLPLARDATATLADHGDYVGFFGEVDDSARTIKPPSTELTTTDMGSGEFAEAGWQHSAYIHNLMYQGEVSREPIGVNDSNHHYDEDGTVQATSDDKTRYDAEAHFDNRGSWGSFFWLGGPGYVPIG